MWENEKGNNYMEPFVNPHAFRQLSLVAQLGIRQKWVNYI